MDTKQTMLLIGKKIAALRKANRISSTLLAERAGVAQSSISNLENGQHSPSLETILKICDVLNVSLRDLSPEEDLTPEIYQIVALAKRLTKEEQQLLIRLLESLLTRKS